MPALLIVRSARFFVPPFSVSVAPAPKSTLPLPLSVPPLQVASPLMTRLPVPLTTPLAISNPLTVGAPFTSRVAPSRRVRPEAVVPSLEIAVIDAPVLSVYVPEANCRSGVDPSVDVVRNVPLDSVATPEPSRRSTPLCTSTRPLLLRST